MKLSEAFPSKYLKADDLNGRAVTLTIVDVQLETLGDGTVKPMVTFTKGNKGLILNKVNGATLASAYGDDTDGWRGKPVELRAEMTSFQGRFVNAIRVRAPQAPAAPFQAPAQPTAAPAAAGLEEDVPW